MLVKKFKFNPINLIKAYCFEKQTTTLHHCLDCVRNPHQPSILTSLMGKPLKNALFLSKKIENIKEKKVEKKTGKRML